MADLASRRARPALRPVDVHAHVAPTAFEPASPVDQIKYASAKDVTHGLPCEKTYRNIAAAERIPQPIYLGLEIEVLQNDNKVRYGVCTHDGSWVLDFYAETLDVSDCKTYTDKVEKFETKIIKDIKAYMRNYNYKVHLIGLGLRVCGETCVDYGKERTYEIYGSDVPSLSSRVWLELDALPYVTRSQGHYLDERASTAARRAVITLSPQVPGNIPRVQVGYRNRVEVDADGDIHLLDLQHYKATSSEATWQVLLGLASEIRARNLRVSFFNSTPQGGGVALMRHAMIRLCTRLQMDVSWYVTSPSPEVFNVTKRKFHNVLQGVAPPETRLTEEDKKKFLEWTKINVERHWSAPDGPIMTSHVIVIDDPQVCGVIPWIRKLNPECRIVYRSHIEVRADLIRNDPKGPQAETWDFLWSAIKQADLFISHPVANFVPDMVPMDHVCLMPAATDPLDGLNKPLDQWSTEYYRQIFNRVCYDQGSRRVDWLRPYIVQVARFDPSKGIPDVLHAFLLLSQKYKEAGLWREDYLHSIPQLVICGHGSVDDPDGTWVFEQAHEILSSQLYAEVAPHVIVSRIPPCDQLLNVAISGATAALQLSHREGFEVKVTEAVSKGVPIVAYRAGGIPFQVKHGQNGYLVPVGDTQAVADRLFELCTDKDLRNRMSEFGLKYTGDEYFTVHNLVNWQYVWLKLVDRPRKTTTAEGQDTAEARAARQEQCLTIDGTTELCTPKLTLAKQRQDTLGGGVWVRDLWRREHVETIPVLEKHKQHHDAFMARTWEALADERRSSLHQPSSTQTDTQTGTMQPE